MTSEKIDKLDELLQQHISDSKKITDVKLSRLTAPGENYGGILLKADITLQSNENGSQEVMYTVAKLIPSNEFLQKVFNIQVSCKKEIAFYDSIVPTLQQFQRDQGVDRVIDFFPKMHAARINLDGSDKVDENSVILMENLVHEGYKNVDRMNGLNWETTKLILRDLATFHAVPLALKLQKPDVFEQKIKPYLTALGPPPPSPPGNEKLGSSPENIMIEFIESNEECRTLAPKIQQTLFKHRETKPCKEPYATITHGDMWINNFMVKFKDGKPVSNKFVDFQNYTYGSPANDLMFLLWSSVQENILEEHLDALITFYHSCLIGELERLKCDITPFSFDNFLAEIEASSKFETGHALFMIMFVVLAGKSAIPPDPSKPPNFGTVEDITPEAKDKILYMLRTCEKKGWL